MSLLPWQSFQLRRQLSRDQVLDGLKWTIPACCRWPDLLDNPQYFCGSVNVEAGTFRFQQNTALGWRSISRLRGLLLLRCRVRPAPRGSLIEVSITPGAAFWIGMLPIFFFATFIPLGLLLWLFNAPMQQGSPLGFIVIPLLALIGLCWWWPLLAITYSCLPRYRKEISELLKRLTERFDGGLPVLELADTPQQVEIKHRCRVRAGQSTLRLIGAILTLMGIGLFGFGLEGVRTGQVTLHGRNRHHRKVEAPRKVTLIGEQAATVAKSLIAIGSGLAVSGGVCWLVARHDLAFFQRRPKSRFGAWPPLETSLLAISIVLLVLGAVFGIKSFW